MNLYFLSGVFANPWNIVRSLIEIAIIAVALYILLKQIRGSRAEQVLKGLLVLLVFSVAANVLHFTVVYWTLEKIWILLAIALPIVFQPELRRFLEQLGSRKFFFRNNTLDQESYESIIQEICSAVVNMQHNRTGALIVMVREIGIREYMNSGTPLDAFVSASLLVNLFTPYSPLHDGAVIINQGRIEKAGVVLPLSTHADLDQSLGTRHRAALGITEVSDAVSIVVSEETGVISLVEQGSLQRRLQVHELSAKLTRELIPAAPAKPSWFRRFFYGGE